MEVIVNNQGHKVMVENSNTKSIVMHVNYAAGIKTIKTIKKKLCCTTNISGSCQYAASFPQDMFLSSLTKEALF